MNKLVVSIFQWLLLAKLHIFGSTLFEYVCDEKQLYKPYVHVYQQRKGPRILDLGPGFHDMSDYQNVYICVNGLAYMYFAKTTSLSEVYDAPHLKTYAHTCEMYNVQPRKGSATVSEVTLYLRAILLLGDPTDYRLPSIQEFTAPYYFRKDQLNRYLETDPDYELQPPLYMNASSVIIIGQSECTLSKGGGNSLIKIRPHFYEPEKPSTEIKAEVGYYCKIGYLPILDKASTPPGGPIPAESERAPALALINDEAIRVEKCLSYSKFDHVKSSEKFITITGEISEIDSELEQNKQMHLDRFNAEISPVIEQLNEEKEKLEARKKKAKVKQREIKRLDKQLERVNMRIKLETSKKTAFEGALNAVSDQLAKIIPLKTEANPEEAKGMKAKEDAENAEEMLQNLERIKNLTPPAPEEDIEGKRVAYEEALREAQVSARDYQNALSDLEVALLQLNMAVERVRRLSSYVPSPEIPNNWKSISGGKEMVTLNPEGSPSVVITAKETDCERLPVLEGDDGECSKGKPEKEYACSLFSTTLGVKDPWEELTPPPDESSHPTEFWKKQVLDLIGDIFSTACDRILNVKKFVNVNNRVMGFYLTNEKIFNMPPNSMTDTCINRFETSMNSDSEESMKLNFKEEKQFWTTLKFVLKQCKMEGRRLAFKENDTVAGQFKFVKNYGTELPEMYEVPRRDEQADIEYSYNWSIDMNWKMFVTVMGVCMSGYEKKIPLIASRFFSLYTEDFLIPLRETWVNPKDNIMFQFILSEFYNQHTEYWMDMCMESSFIYAGQQDFRPPRSLMVNCHSENNYFVNEIFSNGGNT